MSSSKLTVPVNPDDIPDVCPGCGLYTGDDVAKIKHWFAARLIGQNEKDTLQRINGSHPMHQLTQEEKEQKSHDQDGVRAGGTRSASDGGHLPVARWRQFRGYLVHLVFGARHGLRGDRAHGGQKSPTTVAATEQVIEIISLPKWLVIGQFGVSGLAAGSLFCAGMAVSILAMPYAAAALRYGPFAFWVDLVSWLWWHGWFSVTGTAGLALGLFFYHVEVMRWTRIILIVEAVLSLAGFGTLMLGWLWWLVIRK